VPTIPIVADITAVIPMAVDRVPIHATHNDAIIAAIPPRARDPRRAGIIAGSPHIPHAYPTPGHEGTAATTSARGPTPT
jgi:hypothetical protein